ncbi:MAG: hypothetical protein JXB35_13675, partial [Anaerolineae bacterium]|nr:hypothetical protein [Anaerolineae bacterium]
MRRFLIPLLLVLVLLLAACGPTQEPEVATPEPTTEAPTQESDIAESGDTLSLAGSTTVQPVAEQLAA